MSEGEPEVTLSAAPVTYRRISGGDTPKPNRHAFSQSIIRDLCKAHKDYGRESPYFRGLLTADLAGVHVVPADLRQLFSCLMNGTEFKLWDAEFKQALREAMPQLPFPAVDEQGNPLSLELLAGEGTYVSPESQAALIPSAVLSIIKDIACKAFFCLQPDAPSPPYTTIRQGPSESFVAFVERLTRAVEIQIKTESAREGIIGELVFVNANDLCKQAILSLPLDPPRTLQSMLQVCQMKVPFLARRNPPPPSQATFPPKTVRAADTSQQPRHCLPQRRPSFGTDTGLPTALGDLQNSVLQLHLRERWCLPRHSKKH
ncbi:uncharacterized protein LOC134562062 isoform X2 [Prinia subflava]|uniref:uncharacterized protein LOC134562062 isoform X2 n=1 Tax=Prinia subflava TaxID=208062 RepID=UPI002FE2DD44